MNPHPPRHMPLPKELVLADLDSELAASRRLLARVPHGRFDWRPHEKSTPLGELANHVVNITGWQVSILTADELDFASGAAANAAAVDVRGLLEAFDRNVAALRAALAAADDATLQRDWTLRFGEHVVFTEPKLVCLRSFGTGHVAHHRGQLTVYLRLLGVPVPQVYGPTADEQ